jgi:hypothetical protein
VSWRLSADVHEFDAVAGDFLREHPVDHTVLLTETAYLTARPSAATDQLYGWFQPADGPVSAAFVQAPRHAPVLSLAPPAAIESLVDVLPDLTRIGVDGRLVVDVAAAWRDRTPLVERSRIRLYRLDEWRPRALPTGQARVATLDDRDRLVDWFGQLMAAHPDDPSELAYVVDDPLSYGGITLWEIDGVPVAMAGRSRLVAGMVRLGAVFAPDHADHGDAAFVAAIQAARGIADDVLVFAASHDAAGDAHYRSLGFVPVLDRVMLGAGTD